MKIFNNFWQYTIKYCLSLLFLFSTLVASATTTTTSINGSASVCEGDVITYSVSYTAGHIYNWTSTGGTGIATVNTNNNTSVYTVTWGLAGTGTVSLQEISNGTIINNTSINVTINSTPNPMIISDFDSDCITDSLYFPGHSAPPSFECHTVCEGTAVTYTTALVGGNSYQWNVIGSYNSITGATTNSATVSWGTPGSALVVVIETTPAGCTQTDTVCIEIVDKPTSGFKVNQGTSSIFSTPVGTAPNTISICKDGTICFDDLSVGGTSWFWDFGNGNTSQQQNPCETFTTSGIFTVLQIVENDCQCRDTSYIEVHVSTEVGPEIVCQNTICNNGTFVYDAILPSPCVGGFYQWSISNNGTIVSLNGTGTTIGAQTASGTDATSIEINWGSGPIGVISLSITGCQGVCSQVTTVNIPIIPNTLDIEGDELVCSGEFGNYQVPCFPGTTYQWKVNGVLQSDIDHDLTYQFGSAGTYTITVSYTNSFLSCSGSSNTFIVEVKDPFSISGVTEICEGTSTIISGPGGSQLDWEVKNQSGTVVATGGTTSSYTVPTTLAPGSYSIIAEDASSPRDYCNDYAIHGLVVIAKPPAPTVINGVDEVCPGEVEVYTASATSSEYYLEWEVNNGGTISTTNGNSVTVTWSTGVKSITLYHVSKIGDCKSNGYVLTVTDKTLPTISISGPNAVCANTPTAAPEVYSTTALLHGYNWTISPATAGSVVSGQGTSTINVIWNNYSGTANVVLTPEICGNSFPATSYTVNVNNPVLSITGPTNVCQNSSNSWNASFSFGSGSGYTWDIQDLSGNSIASGSGSTINYNFPSNSGSFVLVVSATNCGTQHTATYNITVDPAPVGNLTYTGNINCIDQNMVTFFVTVQGIGPYTYDWYKNSTFIGNLGTTHTIGNNPADAGIYNVVITDANGCTSSTNFITVTVCSTPPPPCISLGGSVSFIAQPYQTSPVPGCNVVRFQESIVGPTPTSLSWDFAGIGSASGSMPIFSFPASGVYPVTLTASYANPPYPPNSCDTSFTFDVVVPVVSDYELNISCSGGGFVVDLINTSDVVHGPLSLFTHNWTVTDITGTPFVVGTSTAQDYLNVPGLVAGNTYEVTLTESRSYTWNGQTINALCTHVETFTMPASTIASFAASTNVVCEGNALTFSNQSTGNIIGWSWDFGDGSGILTQHPAKTYTSPGIYTVTLTITDEFGCTDSYSSNIDVKANNISGSIAVTPVMPMCPGTTANLLFTNTTSPSSAPYIYTWSDGTNGISTTATQTSTHYLNVTDTYDCFASFGPEIVEVVEIPHAIIIGEDEYCVGDLISLYCNYGGSYNYKWYQQLSGAGSFSYTGVMGTAFNIASAPLGTHQFKVELEEPISGCTKESLIFTVVVHPLPVPPIITTNPTPACPDVPVQLTVTNSAAYNYITWSTGDVNTSTLANNSGTYYAVGTDANGCSNYSSTTVFELPDFCSFMCGCYSDCINPGSSYNFPGILGSYANWRWEQLIGNNWVTVSSGTGTVNDFVATSIGNYTIRLYVETYDGCDGYSCEVDLVLTPCGGSQDCEGNASMQEVHCEIDSDNNVIYNFGMSINFPPFGVPCNHFTYTIIPPFGNVQTFSSSIAPFGSIINGTWYTGLSYHGGGMVCFDVIITNQCDLTTCMYTVCFYVPPCGDPDAPEGRFRSPNEEISLEDNIQFFPNPARDVVKMKVNVEDNYQIIIYDMSGKTVLEQNITMSAGKVVEMNLSGLPTGPYNIQCIGNEQIKTQRLIILKE